MAGGRTPALNWRAIQLVTLFSGAPRKARSARFCFVFLIIHARFMVAMDLAPDKGLLLLVDDKLSRIAPLADIKVMEALASVAAKNKSCGRALKDQWKVLTADGIGGR